MHSKIQPPSLSSTPNPTLQSRRSFTIWHILAVLVGIILVPWGLYASFSSRLSSIGEGSPIIEIPSVAKISNEIELTKTNHDLERSNPDINDQMKQLVIEKEKFELERQKFADERERLRKENIKLREEQTKLAIEKEKEEKQEKSKKNKQLKQKSSIEMKPSPKQALTSFKSDQEPVIRELRKNKDGPKMKDGPRQNKQGPRKKKMKGEQIDLPIKTDLNMEEIGSTPPVLGPVVTNGMKPLFGMKHEGGDAIFALACKYPKQFYQRFVGSVREAGYTGDVVLAVSPPSQMKPGVKEYLQETRVVAYGFEVDCEGPDNCKLKDEFLGYPDPRPYRTFANIRYALYEYWLTYYTDRSYILILDFRDTFFQRDPFEHLGPVHKRSVVYDLQVFAENWKVKKLGKCVYNSLWLGRCFGRDQLEPLKENAVICSGSTMGSLPGIYHYVRTMLTAMDRVKCWLKNIESDQGYQNYLFYNGHFDTKYGNATIHHQGTGVVNTIGAMNGFRVPAHMKGPLDTHWKIRDKDGYLLNNDGTRSACVHQWDRFFAELHKWVDSKLYKK